MFNLNKHRAITGKILIKKAAIFCFYFKLPKFIVLPFLFVTITYWMANLNHYASSFFLCCFIIILVANCAVSFGNMLFFNSNFYSNNFYLIFDFKAHFYRYFFKLQMYVFITIIAYI